MDAIAWEPYVPGVKPPTAEIVAGLERSKGVKLPEDYKAALVRHAGEAPVKSAIAVGQSSKTAFGPLLFTPAETNHPERPYSIEAGLEALADNGWQPAGRVRYWPFANNTASGYFCLDLAASGSSQPVVFIDLQYGPNEPGGVLPVAPSFTATLDKLED